MMPLGSLTQVLRMLLHRFGWPNGLRLEGVVSGHREQCGEGEGDMAFKVVQEGVSCDHRGWEPRLYSSVGHIGGTRLGPTLSSGQELCFPNLRAYE